MGSDPKQRNIASFFSKVTKPTDADAGAAPNDTSKENKRAPAASDAKKAASSEVWAPAMGGAERAVLLCRFAPGGVLQPSAHPPLLKHTPHSLLPMAGASSA